MSYFLKLGVATDDGKKHKQCEERVAVARVEFYRAVTST
jgi:hypothetical protein